MLSTIALKRLHLISYATEAPFRPFLGATLNAEVGQLGFRIKNYLQITALSSEDLEFVLHTLKQMRGDNVSYVPLFTSFPDRIPYQWLYLTKRILSHFDLYSFDELEQSSFGADPTTQRQSLQLYEQALAKQKEKIGDSHIEWIELTALPLERVKLRLVEWVLNLIYGQTPIRETLWDDILYCLNELSIPFDFERVVIKETKVRLAAKLWLSSNSLTGLKTPTDLLRLLAYQTGQDISLSEPVSLKGLKYSKPQRRVILNFLEHCSNLEEDLLRYRGLWKKVLAGLHPGDYKNKFPQVVRAYDRLIQDKIVSFESRVELAEGKERLMLLAHRPSMLIRKLSSLIGEVDIDLLLATLENLESEELPLPLLMQAFFALNYKGKRLVINKRGKAYNIDSSSLSKFNEQQRLFSNISKGSQTVQIRGIKVIPSKQAQKTNILATCNKERREIPPKLRVNRTLNALICTKLQNPKYFGTKVWIDPRLFSVVLPLQAKKQSEGLLNLARGTRIKLGEQPVLRSFVYWKQQEQRTDLDLALMKLDENFQYVGKVSWSDYDRSGDILFSGDVQSAELGASEFIDIKLDKIEQNNPYLVISVLVYAGENFSEVTACYSGWMMRERPENDVAVFDAKTVQNKVTVKTTTQAQFWIPFIIDTRKRELIYVDLYSKGQKIIERNKHLTKTVAALVKYNQYRPNFGALAHWFKKANKCQLTTRESAEVTIGLDKDCTVNVHKLMGDNIFTFALDQ